VDRLGRVFTHAVRELIRRVGQALCRDAANLDLHGLGGLEPVAHAFEDYDRTGWVTSAVHGLLTESTPARTTITGVSSELTIRDADVGTVPSPAKGGAPASKAPALDDPALYFNRELSWLDFNDRVLQLAEDQSVPLLERVKFCAIWESNLDEFFMVRVANLEEKLEAGRDAPGPDGMSLTDQVAEIHHRVVAQRKRVSATFKEMRPLLAEHGIRILPVAEASKDEREELSRLFERQVFPALTPLVIGLGRPFPYISNLSLSLAVALRDPEQDTEVLARVKVPKELLGRFLPIGEDGSTLVPLDDLIAANLDSLFPGMEVLRYSFFRVTRDTDYDVSDEADDLLQAVQEELRRRRFGEVVRLEVEAGMDPGLRSQLVSAMGLEEREAYEVNGLLDLTDLWDLYGVKGLSKKLRDPDHVPVTQPRLLGEEGKDADIFAAMRAGDILVHHPYDSFTTSVERFVRQAVADPDVLAIKQTVYRTSADSPLVPSLIAAAERGKQAVCVVELKARFDEQANITWAKKLEQAGVHVVYGIPSLKTHVKSILVVRREGDGVRHYAHIGTGNYNPKTARIYTDLGLFTCDEDIGSDIAEMFNYITGYARPTGFRRALIAPHNLSEEMIGEIDRTIEAHSPDTPARIRMKMNSLLDAKSVRALYRASQAGVEVQLNVRGICALRPGVPGVSENIKVTSIVGRFLEHSRIYSFERPGDDPCVYIGSADLMPRNLYNRVELVVPIRDDRVRAELTDVLDRSMADDTNSWELGSDGRWTRREAAAGRSVQRELIERHVARSSEAAH
jgi:polyphosphate kinase